MNKHLLSSFRSNVKHWWISLIVGIIAVALGLACLFTPILAFATLSLLFVISFFIGGISDIAFAIANRYTLKNWGWILAVGIINLIFATILVTNPLLAPLILSYLIAFWLLLQSIWGLGMSFDLQSVRGSGWGWFLALSILGVLASLLLLFRPEVAALFTVYILSMGLFCYGIFRIYLSIRLKSLEKYLPEEED